MAATAGSVFNYWNIKSEIMTQENVVISDVGRECTVADPSVAFS